MSESEIAPEIVAHIADIKRASRDIATYSLPQLPEHKAWEVYERISEHEARLAAISDSEAAYDRGVAKQSDEIAFVLGDLPALMTTEHATTQIRSGAPKQADFGTAGLAGILHEDVGLSFITALGQQTGDANHDLEHPLKDELTRVMQAHRPRSFTALHAMGSDKITALSDKKAINVIVGIGNKPNPDSLAVAESTVAYANELGLRAGINQDFVKIVDGQPVVNEDGTFALSSLAATGKSRTRTHAETVATQMGYTPALAQIELSSILRILPSEYRLDETSRVMGAYLGYLVTRHLVEAGLAVKTEPLMRP